MDIYGDMNPGDLNDTLVGTDDPDTIFGGQGNDSIDGGLGADSLDGGVGNDTITAGPTDATDTLVGGDGDDLYIVHGGSPTITETATGGTDTVQSDADYINLSSYANVENAALTGSGSYSEVDGNALDNVLSSSASANYGYLYGGDGADSLYLNDLYGGYAYGGDGADSVAAYGSDGAQQQIFGDAGADTLDAEEARGSTSLYGGDDGDRLIGSGNADSLYGEGGSDSVFGGGGDDYIKTLTGEGPDTIDGGMGTDLLTIERTDSTFALSFDVTAGGTQLLGEGSSITGIEQIRIAGGTLGDSFTGGALDDVLKGMGGNDTLVGGGGNDVLQGGVGHDSLTGGAGADIFRFDGPFGGQDDTVTDFVSGTDRVGLSHIGFGIASLSDFDIVTAASGPTEAKATLIVDTVAHTISWDADGNGAGAAVLLAHGAFTTNSADYMVF